MSQSVLAVNLTKKQYISPWGCDSHSGFLADVMAPEAFSLALCALLFDANDYAFQNPRELCIPSKTDKSVKLNPDPEGRLIGSWAGDKITITGEYQNGERYATAAQKRSHTKRVAKALLKSQSEDNGAPPEMAYPTLYTTAYMLFDDISEKIMVLLGQCGYGSRATDPESHKRRVHKILRERLLVDFNAGRNGAGSVDAGRDLTWISIYDINQLLSFPDDWSDEHRESMKRWLLSQRLSEEGREFVETFKGDATSLEDKASRREILSASKRDEHWYRILPSPEVMAAAMYVQRRLDGGPAEQKFEKKQIVHEIKSKLGIRDRVIDVT